MRERLLLRMTNRGCQSNNQSTNEIILNTGRRAELSRYIFAVAEKPYEDNRIDKEQWMKLKPNTPFGHLPILEVNDGKTVNILSESSSIARFLARELGLAGKDSWEQALCDQYIEFCSDLFNEGSKSHFEKDETKKAELMKKLLDETCVNHMNLLEKSLGDKNYLVGDKISVADLSVFQVFDTLLQIKADLMDKHSKLKSHRQRVYKKLGTYIENRPQTAI